MWGNVAKHVWRTVRVSWRRVRTKPRGGGGGGSTQTTTTVSVGLSLEGLGKMVKDNVVQPFVVSDLTIMERLVHHLPTAVNVSCVAYLLYGIACSPAQC